MRSLLISPKFPSTFCTYEPILKLVGKKAPMPPLDLMVVSRFRSVFLGSETPDAESLERPGEFRGLGTALGCARGRARAGRSRCA